MRTLLLATACSALFLAGCTSEKSMPEEEAVEAPTLSDERKTEIDAMSNEDLIQLVRSANGVEFSYADVRLAGILKETEDADLIALATTPRLPFGQAMNQANRAKDRLPKK